MAYKDRIYDITAWDMSKRLEFFLNDILRADGDGAIKCTDKNEKIFSKAFAEKKSIPTIIKTLGEKIKYFHAEKILGAKNDRETCEINRIYKKMEQINKNRNSIVHPKKIAPVLDRDKFKKLQETCFELEGKIKDLDKKYKKIRIKEVLPTLEYDMGNAGDIIKHGLLVEFIEWWGKTNRDKIYRGQSMKIADTFCGCPWDNMSDKIRRRLDELKETRLSVIQRDPEIADTYMGSSFLMFKAAIKKGIPVQINVSDNDEDARCNWHNVTMEYKDRIKQSIKLICPRLDNNDGYKILDSKSREYNLILLDPYSRFLRNEFHRKGNLEYFPQILDLVKRDSNLFVAVFVLDMDSTNEIGKNYAAFKKNELHKFTFSLRCPKIRKKTKISGESSFNSEILLISKQIADKKCGELRKRLINFAKKVTKVLPLPAGKEVEFWPHE